MSITINLEIGHDASLRTKTTPEGFTHDWEVFVKGCNGAEIHHYVEKVVFHLHETFPKPKRVVKEPPYSLRTSGYAGFNLPIEVYLKNNQEPKKIKFNYDLQLQPTGPPIHKVQKEKYVFNSPSEEFRSRLLKGGGTVGSSGFANDALEAKVTDEKNQNMTSKPKLSGSEVAKKHKIKLDEPRNTDFVNLFGPPITKTTSKTTEVQKPKEVSKNSSKPEKPVEKDKTKTKSPHKDKEKDKSKDKDKSSESSEKRKEEKKKSKEDKNKDRERSKDKSSKKDKERDKSPAPRPRSPSPKRSPKRAVTPPPPSKHSSSKDKDQSKDEKKEKERKEEKKNKREKREHKESKHKDKDRDKDKDHKEHKNRDSKSSKESGGKEKDISPSPVAAAVPAVSVPSSQPPQKTEKKSKEKEPVKEAKEDEKPEKSRQEKSEDKQKHKHKKKDRKEKRDDKYAKNEKKSDKPSNASVIKEEPKEALPISSSRDTDKNNLFGSPKSDPPSTPNQIEVKSEKPQNIVTTLKEEETSNDSTKISSRDASPAPRVPSKSPSPPSVEPVKKVEPEKKKEESPKKKEKKEKKKDKKSEKDHEKRRKRKSPATHTEAEQPPEKVLKEEENNNSDDERKVSSTEDANPLPANEADDYMGMLRELQHKIMGLKDNSDLQKVVQLIAETGRYEVSAHTFDFDLCLLDRSTVKQLQDFFASIS